MPDSKSTEKFNKTPMLQSINDKASRSSSSLNSTPGTISPLNPHILRTTTSMTRLRSYSNTPLPTSRKTSIPNDLQRKPSGKPFQPHPKDPLYITSLEAGPRSRSHSNTSNDTDFTISAQSSSSNPSRRGSIANNVHELDSTTVMNLPKLSLQKQAQGSSIELQKTDTNDYNISPGSMSAVSMTPERRSVTTTFYNSPVNSSKTSTSSFQDGTPTLHMDNSPEDTYGSSSNIISRPILSNSKMLSSQRLFERQYILNEKKYLEGMKKLITDDDYYTRTINFPPIELDDEDNDFEKDSQRGHDEINEIMDTSNDSFVNSKDYNILESNKKNKSIENFQMEKDINMRIFHGTNSSSISPSYLLRKLKWLSDVSPDNTFVKEILNGVQDASNNGIGPSGDEHNLSETIQKLFQQSNVAERFEWLIMLTNVLKGDIVRSEKTKLAKEKNGVNTNYQYADNIWLELRAWMNGRTKDEQERSLKVLRDNSDAFFEEIMNFKVAEGVTRTESEVIVDEILKKYYKIINFWPNIRKLNIDKPITNTIAFTQRVDALISWQNAIWNYKSKKKLLEDWIGIPDLAKLFDDELKSKRALFTEQLIKERDIESIFQKKIFFPLAPGILKAKIFYLNNKELIDEMKLVYSNKELSCLLLFPIKLIKEIIILRIEYAKKLQNPTMMMVDQMVDDFTAYIRLAVQLKATLMDYYYDWPFEVKFDKGFDKTVVDAIHYLFVLVQLKILDNSDKIYKSFREPEVLLKFWEELKNVGPYIDGAAVVIANGFAKLTLRLLQRLNSYLNFQEDGPLNTEMSGDTEKWLSHTLDSLGSMKRKLNRFTNLITKAFENSVSFKVDDYEKLLTTLENSGHFLIYTGGELEENGIFLIGSSELLGIEDEDLMKILKSSDIGSDLIPKLNIENSLSIYNALQVQRDPDIPLSKDIDDDGVPRHNIGGFSEILSNYQEASRTHMKTHNINKINKRINKNYTTSKRNKTLPLNSSPVEDAERELFELEIRLHTLGYVLVLVPDRPVLWKGESYNLSSTTAISYEDFVHNHHEINSITLINQGSCYALEYQCDRFRQVADDCVSFLNRKCMVENVDVALSKIDKMHYSCTYNSLVTYPYLINKFKPICNTKDLLNGVFLFVRDFCNGVLSNTTYGSEKKSLIVLLMVKLSLNWLTYLVEDCDPTDPKTFRWCVTAMEFTLQMISGLNILTLDESQFKCLKQKISACMSLMISHFDVMGARANEVENIHQQTRANIEIVDDFDVDAMLEVNSQLRLKSIQELEKTIVVNPHQRGKVLDDKVKTDKYLTSLASSISNVSIRWQKRKFIGGGTFGAVFSAVNLDNGDILAVKEIKIQDSKTMEKIFPSIKEEMSVLEMMNHPNIIQYYGVEVHRDKVNIFMEYCEGGSLATLLEHGRIEDEMVTQVYTLELLEGLAYLHESGIVHRDIKPENILLDFNGIIKYVDFGAARKIIRNGTIRKTTTPVVEQKDSDETSIDSSDPSSKHKNAEDNMQNMIGTPMYMAPEAITGSKNHGRLGADDIWSLGCVVLEMITGRRPWANLDNEWAIMYHVAAGQIPPSPSTDEVSESGMAFLKRCLVQDPDKRATAVELLMDPWIVQIRNIAFGNGDHNMALDDKN
ncbi:similar to Saccharomyces cerevisiae YCR073C SSK22 MAP kinase kinase kinase of the HOG1 mitogen-activated signaling pathway [Maudiozyma saulgeensis]|uniref:Similar to Saccharomyces cerevisiae YCR073C SSK22 MAP kinase kinase kinase of the HOG1 mitogen-activated signaling pathway n=1 Tax=Maudiozyma saulgeensis TaxID=1789683 RepID=A0A1X7R7F2_9SACH|nr:similar to Saccharomyces cerevisiae YCR073C SSK22 MAP kinase kinase kinase of the HOG1 mitogen-activated signaling pathway [Kazachstania saulgeensis]